MVNRQGEVVGINSAIQTAGAPGNVGIGFVIPIDLAETIADKLVAGEEIDFGFLGVSTGESTDGPAGALVVEVTDGDAAAEAGIEPGDLITDVDGQPVRAFGDLASAIRAHQPGDVIDIVIVRAGVGQTVTVTLGSLDQQQ